jgi:hypothetical protein
MGQSRSTELLVGSGITYSARSTALQTNPAALAEGSGSELSVLGELDPDQLRGNLVGTSGSLGWGLGVQSYLDVANLFEAGFALNLGMTKFGASFLTNDEFDSVSSSVGVNFDLSSLRLSVIARGLDEDLNRVDVGLGWMGSNWRFEIAAKKPRPFDNSNLVFDVGFAVQAGKVGVGVGYDFSYILEEFREGDFHGSLKYQVTKNLGVEAHYRPWVYESGFFDWAAGVSFRF